MFNCKSLVILLLLVAVSVGQRHNYMPCEPLPGDTLLRRESSAKSFKFLGHMSATVHIDVGDNIIGCVHAIDQWDDGTGGYAEFVDGGIGYNHVDVKITSQFSRGFYFVIEVYGQKTRKCKYIRKCCVKFRTCPHTQILTADTLLFTPKFFRLERSLNTFLFAETAFVVSLSTNS